MEWALSVCPAYKKSIMVCLYQFGALPDGPWSKWTSPESYKLRFDIYGWGREGGGGGQLRW